MPIDSPFVVYRIVCPACGHAHDWTPPLARVPELSPLAFRILTAHHVDASKWRRGKHLSLRQWAAIVHSNHVTVLYAMRELAECGYVVRIQRGQRGGVYYMSVPTMVLPLEAIA